MADPASAEEDAAWDIASRILGSETVEDVLAESKTLSVEEDFMHVPFMLHDFRLRQSTKFRKDGETPDVFGLFEITTTGAAGKQLLTCGAVNVLAQAVRLKELGALPKMVEVCQTEKATAAGFHPLWLREPSVHNVKASANGDKPF
jgi:hypothetical protein